MVVGMATHQTWHAGERAMRLGVPPAEADRYLIGRLMLEGAEGAEEVPA